MDRLIINISMSEKKYNIGLVLSGGGARGFAHLGVNPGSE